MDPEAARFRLFEAAASLLQNAAQTRPIVLILDDLHWADKPSLLLLQFLAAALQEARLLVVGIYRDTDLDRRHPLAEVLPALRRAPAFERILLRGLPREEVERLLASRAGHELDAAGEGLAEALRRETEGNPFFIGEVLRHLAESGTLRQRDGRWTMQAASIAELGIPEGVRDVVGRRLSRLPEETSRLLTLAALIGREFDLDVLASVAGRSEDDGLDALDGAVSARVLDEVRGAADRYRFAHALIGQTLREVLSAGRRRRLHRPVGEALEAHYGSHAAAHATELAHHFAEAGESEKAVRYSVLAAEQAEATTAWEEAARHYEQALTLMGEADATFEQDEAALLTHLGACLRNSGEYRAAWRNLMRAIDRFRQRGDGTGQARATLEALDIVAPPERQVALARAALEVLGDDEAAPELAGQLLTSLLRPGGAEPCEATEYAALRERAEVLVARHSVPAVAARLASLDCFEAMKRGDIETALVLSREAHVALAALGQVSRAALALGSQPTILLKAGRLEEGEADAEATLAYARHHVTRMERIMLLDLAALRLARADYSAADALLAGAAPEAFDLHLLEALRWTHVGDWARAVEALPEPQHAAGIAGYLVAIHAVRARVLWHAGEAGVARREWGRVLELLPSGPRTPRLDGYSHVLPSTPVATLHAGDALPHLADGDFLAAAALLLEQESTGRAQVFVAPLGESALRQRALLRLWLGELEKAEAGPHPALAWCEQERCPIEAGRCLLGLAEIAERGGQREQALAYLGRAAVILEQYGAKLYLDQARRMLASLSS